MTLTRRSFIGCLSAIPALVSLRPLNAPLPKTPQPFKIDRELEARALESAKFDWHSWERGSTPDAPTILTVSKRG